MKSQTNSNKLRGSSNYDLC